MTTDAFRLHARIVLYFYTSIGTTKKILNLFLIVYCCLIYLPTADLLQSDTMNILLSRNAYKYCFYRACSLYGHVKKCQPRFNPVPYMGQAL